MISDYINQSKLIFSFFSLLLSRLQRKNQLKQLWEYQNQNLKKNLNHMQSLSIDLDNRGELLSITFLKCCRYKMRSEDSTQRFFRKFIHRRWFQLVISWNHFTGLIDTKTCSLQAFSRWVETSSLIAGFQSPGHVKRQSKKARSVEKYEKWN